MNADSWPQPSRLRTWTDAEGTAWHRVGADSMSVKSARRAFADPDRLVVHFYGAIPTVIAHADHRAELWSRIEPIMRGDDVNPFAEVTVYRYRTDSGASMIAVQESC